MRYLGIDWGDKKIGLAVSDEELKIAFPRQVWSPETFWREIAKLIKEEKIVKIIVGLPLSFLSADTRQANRVKKAAEKIQKVTGLKIEFQNEILTTKMAEETSGQKTADASAAALILQSYLDKTK